MSLRLNVVSGIEVCSPSDQSESEILSSFVPSKEHQAETIRLWKTATQLPLIAVRILAA